MVSQTQSDDEDYPPSDDDLHDQMARCDGIGDFNSMATALNISLENGENIFNPFELDIIEDHRHLPGVLELYVSYDTANKDINDASWHPIDLVKDEDPQAVAQYILSNNLKRISNGIHRR